MPPSATFLPPAAFDDRATVLPRERAAGVHAERYPMIDVWRGLAALTVVAHHLTQQTELPGLAAIDAGHWAVMVFFVISGYCIASAADSCQRKGLSFKTFMARRLRRIYPPYMLAVGYFAASRLVKMAALGESGLSTDPVRWLQNLTLTQWVTLTTGPKYLAFDNSTNFVAAYWSLNYEEQFYLVVAGLILVSTRLRQPLLIVSLPVLGLALLWNLWQPQWSYGLFIEYWAHFGVGILVFFRLCRLERPLHRRLVDGGLVLFFAAASVAAWRDGVDFAAGRPLSAELTVASGFGLLLIATRRISDRFVTTAPGRLLGVLGALTYSLYLIHQCHLFISSRVAGLFVEPGWASLAIQLVVHVVLILPFYWFCERPFLNKPLPATPELKPVPVASKRQAIAA